MTKIYNILLLIATILLFEKSRGQSVGDIKFDLYDVDDGLAGTWIGSMAQDRYGRLWIGTNEGLSSFDGHQFSSFTHAKNDSTSLLSDYVQSLHADQNGQIWVGYSRGGISKYSDSCHCFKHYQRPSEQAAKMQFFSTYILDIENDSLVWYSGMGKGLNIRNIHTGKELHFDLPCIDTFSDKTTRLNFNTVFDIYKENKNNIWLATHNGLYCFRLDEKKLEYFPSDTNPDMTYRNNCFLKMEPDADRGLWLFAVRGGISYYDKNKKTFTVYKFEKELGSRYYANLTHSSAKKNNNEFWIATADSGLGIFNTTTRSFYFPKYSTESNNEFNTRGINKLYSTDNNILFLNHDNGLLQITVNDKPFKFKSLISDKKHPEKHGWIYGIYEDSVSQRIYFAESFGNGLYIENTRTNKSSLIPVDVPSGEKNNFQFVLNVLSDKSKKIWVLSPYYLYIFDETNNQLIKKAASRDLFTSKNRELFTNVFFNNDDDCWFLSSRGNFYKYNIKLNKIEETINSKNGGPSVVKYVCIDNKSRIWMASDTTCVFYDKRTKMIYKLANHKLDSLSRNSMFGLVSDINGNIWLGIRSFGLVKVTEYGTNTFELRAIGPSEGIPTTKLYRLGSDAKGNIWISSKIGILLVKNNPISFSLFNRSAGIDKNTANMFFINAGRNSFYIATENKYCKVDESVIRTPLPVPSAYIDKIKVMNASRNFDINSGRPVVLKPSDNFFSIEYGCIDFIDQASDQFAYKLEGWDDDWVYSGNRRFANYTNLDGGEYIFRVKASNGSGNWGKSVSIPVIIEKPFFKKPWFILLLVAGLSGVVFAIYKARIRQIRNTEKLKTEFNKKLNETKLQALRAQMNPHFIFNSLNSINRYVIKSEVKVASYYITKFSKLMRLILDNSEHRKVVLSNELEALKLYIEMEALRFDNKFSFELLVDDMVSTDRIEVPPLLIQPYVENAIWHGLLHKEGEGKLTITVKTDDNMLICEVIDNGIGREKAMEYKSKNAPTRKSIGMKLTEERLSMKEMDEEENGSQEVIDLKNEAGDPLGTKVIIKIPI